MEFIAVLSAAGTARIRRIRHLVTSFTSIWLMRSAAPKNNGPVSSYTASSIGIWRSLAGLISSAAAFNCASSTDIVFFAPLEASSSSRFCSSTSSTWSQLLTPISSLMRFMNSRQESTMPTSIATTRSKTTVKKNVITRTAISLFGAVFASLAKVLHWHMLYATMKRIAAIVGIGIQLA